MSLLQMKNICKSFSGVYANENINLTVEKGEIHALLGENGAGKTTLVNIIFGLYSADSGEILWKGSPAGFTSPKEAIAAGVGMVQQHFSLVNKMTVLENVILNLQGNALFGQQGLHLFQHFSMGRGRSPHLHNGKLAGSSLRRSLRSALRGT